MVKASWGRKLICEACSEKFYDLNRKPAICPNCGAEYTDPIVEIAAVGAKQVFTDNVDVVADSNLVGGEASESVAEVEDIEIEDAIDEDTLSLEDTDSDVSVIPDDEEHVEVDSVSDDIDINDNSAGELE